MTAPHSVRILVFGARGLIGHFIAADLRSRHFPVVAVARKFTASQRYVLADSACEFPIGDADAAGLAALLRESSADVVVNCLGNLQTVSGEADIHDAFVARLIEALRSVRRTVLLVHVSIPGSEADDRTEFATTKRSADHRIADSGLPYVILRPGFVVAPTAYGGSALLRSLAVSPFELPAYESSRPFACVAVEDIAATVVRLAERTETGDMPREAIWDLMHPGKPTMGDVVEILRRWLGAEGGMRLTLPRFLLDIGAKAGDFAALLGWRPAMRSTGIAEIRRGVTGDPSQWIATTGIAPRSLEDALQSRSSTIQERWFARLYLLKALILIALVVFWCLSGGIVFAFSFKPAAEILVAHGFSKIAADVATVASSLMDISVGAAIAVRKTSRVGLIAGVGVSLFYMIGAAILAPELWIEPLGALVKTGPAIVLMLVALAISDDR